MRPRRGEDEDGVEIRLFQHFVVVGVGGFGPEETHARLRARRDEITDGRDLRHVHAHEVGQVVGSGHDAAPDDADPHFLLCHSFSPPIRVHKNYRSVSEPTGISITSAWAKVT